MKLKLVRHGEAEWNRSKILMGWHNSPLTELGKQQAQIVASELAKTKVDLIISSDLGRALETARIISLETGAEVLCDWLLRERYHGELEAQPTDTLDWNAPQFQEEGTGIESLAQMSARAQAFIENLKLLPEDYETIVVVAHNGILNSIVSVLNPEHNYKLIENSEIIEFELGEREDK